MLYADIVKIVSKDLNIIDLYHFMLINKHTYQILGETFKERLEDHNFYLITYQSEKYKKIIMNIISMFKDSPITIEISSDGLLVYKEKDGICVKLSGNIFKSFICNHQMKFNINIYRLGRIARDLSNYDEFYIFKELSENKINIFIINKFDRKIKVNYKINL